MNSFPLAIYNKPRKNCICCHLGGFTNGKINEYTYVYIKMDVPVPPTWASPPRLSSFRAVRFSQINTSTKLMCVNTICKSTYARRVSYTSHKCLYVNKEASENRNDIARAEQARGDARETPARLGRRRVRCKNIFFFSHLKKKIREKWCDDDLFNRNFYMYRNLFERV